MFRSHLTKSTIVVPVTTRTPKRLYVTPTPGQPAPGSQERHTRSNNLLYGALGVAAAAGAYYYYAHDISTLEKDREEISRNAHEALQAGKARAGETQKQVQAKYNEMKAAGQEAGASTRSIMDDRLHEAEERVRQSGSDAQAKLDSYKTSAEKTLGDARDSTENLYKDARSATDRKVSELRSDVERKSEEAKSGWFSWLRWKKSKTDDVGTKVEDSAKDITKKR